MGKKEHRFSRAFFVGAGFTASLRYPVGQKLMSDLVAYLSAESDPVKVGGNVLDESWVRLGDPLRAT